MFESRHFQIKKAFLTIAMIAFVATLSAYGQTFNELYNDAAGTINNASTGKITIKADTGRFMNGAPIANINNTGVFEFTGSHGRFTDLTGDTLGSTALGHNQAWAVPGTVSWNKSSGNQYTQYSIWYKILATDSAGTKIIGDSTYVDSLYAPTGGNRDYGNFTFFYTSANAQKVYGESGSSGTTNRYNNLVIQGAGVKAADSLTNVFHNLYLLSSATGGLAVNNTFNVNNSVFTDTASPLNVDSAASQFNTGDSISTIDGTVTLTNGGTFSTADVGLVYINNTATVTNGTFDVNAGDVYVNGTLALGSNATSGLNVAAHRNLTIHGTFTNGFAAATNMTFADSSTVLYNGNTAQTIVPTVAANPYGNLSLDSAAKTASADINLSNDFAMLGHNNLDMGTSNVLVMLDSSASATYQDTSEVIGHMRRVINGFAGELTFNNTATTIIANQNPTHLTSVTLDVRPDSGSASIPVYSTVTDVNRTISASYAQTTNDWGATMKFGYKASEGPSGNQWQLKFKEKIASAPNFEKVATNDSVQHNLNSPWSYASLSNIRATGGKQGQQTALAEIADNSLLFLRGGPTTLISIRSGRWSNPATWDEGIEPTPQDSTVIATGTQVHAGFTRVTDNYATAEAYPDSLARGTFIQTDAALIFGVSPSATGNWAFTTSFGGYGIITNTAAYSGTPGLTSADLTNLASVNESSYAVRGLINYQGSSLNLFRLNNVGAINNGGSISVGQ